MSATIISLKRSTYLDVGDEGTSLDLLSARYKNIRFNLEARQTFLVEQAWEHNAPGIAFQLYRDVDYWPYLLMYNGIVDPIQDLVVGLILQVPAKADIDAYLNLDDSSALASVSV